MQKLREIIAKKFYLNYLFVKFRNIIKPDKNRTLGTSDGFYCFSLFVRLFYFTDKYLNGKRQNSVLEVGCGDTFVTSCLFYFCGYRSIFAIDGYRYLNKEKTVSSLNQAIELLRNRSEKVLNFNPEVDKSVFVRLYQAIPTGDEFDKLAKELRDHVEDYFEGKSTIINYIAPYDLTPEFNVKFDFIFSQAVLEHVFPLDKTLVFLKEMLANGGVMYHSVDFKSHGFSPLFNGHYLMTEDEFKTIASPFVFRMINRYPPSFLNRYFENNFEILDQKSVEMSSNLVLRDIKVPISDKTDLITSSKLWVLKGIN